MDTNDAISPRALLAAVEIVSPDLVVDLAPRR